MEEVGSIIDAFEREHPNPGKVLISKEQIGTGSYRPTFEWGPLARAPRSEIAILVGEFAYNLRAGLDYLVHQIAGIDGAPRVFRYFPTDDDPDQFEKRRGNWLAGVSDDHVELFRRHQPFAGAHWLALLKRINNGDKHQNLTVVVTPLTGEFHVSEERMRPVPDRDDVVELIQENQTVEFLLFDRIEVRMALHILLFEMAQLLEDFRGVFGDEDTFTVSDPGRRIELSR